MTKSNTTIQGVAGDISRRSFLYGLCAAGLWTCGENISSVSADPITATENNPPSSQPSSIEPTPSPTKFIHPGLLHTQADFDRMRRKVAANAHPWIDGWKVLIANDHSKLTWSPNPQAVVYRGSDGVHGENFGAFYHDVAAAYTCALRWKISGDIAYANKSVQILNAWSSKLTAIGGDISGFLASGIQGYQFANAAEIMRTYSRWAPADFRRFQAMMLKVVYPGNHHGLIQSLAPMSVYSSWQLCGIASILAIGVFCDNPTVFNEAITYFKTGLSNGAIAQAVYYIHPGYLGQTQESGRDQGHNTLSLSLMTTICEMAWNQGVDLYGYDNNRVLAGAEYIAKGNLIESGSTYYSVPFATYKNGTVTDTLFSTAGQGSARPEWALIYNHYVNRKGLAAPYCKRFASLTQPEGGGGNYGGDSGGYDQLGYGTLTCTRDPIASGAMPSGLTAIVSEGKVILSWWGSAYATSYNVKRSATPHGPYKTIAFGINDLLTHTDNGLTAGTYYYVVTALTHSGETAASNEATAITATQLHTYLSFDEGRGTHAVDSSGHMHTGLLLNGATWATGKKGHAVSLNGTTSYVSLPPDILLDVADFTITAWAFWNTRANWARIFDFGSGITRYMMLTASSGTGVPRFAMTLTGGGGEQAIDSTTPLPIGHWTHLAVTLAGSTGTLYVNGHIVGTNPALQFAPFRLGSTTQNWIGRSQFPGDSHFNGLIDEFRIYRGALSAAQIADLLTA
jgi:Concanavalin A-like lectin/glucanases superfamily/Alginate lyase